MTRHPNEVYLYTPEGETVPFFGAPDAASFHDGAVQYLSAWVGPAADESDAGVRLFYPASQPWLSDAVDRFKRERLPRLRGLRPSATGFAFLHGDRLVRCWPQSRALHSSDGMTKAPVENTPWRSAVGDDERQHGECEFDDTFEAVRDRVLADRGLS